MSDVESRRTAGTADDDDNDDDSGLLTVEFRPVEVRRVFLCFFGKGPGVEGGCSGSGDEAFSGLGGGIIVGAESGFTGSLGGRTGEFEFSADLAYGINEEDGGFLDPRGWGGFLWG